MTRSSLRSRSKLWLALIEVSLISPGLKPARWKKVRTARLFWSTDACTGARVVPSSEKETLHVAMSAVTSRSETPRTVTDRSAILARRRPSPSTYPLVVKPTAKIATAPKRTARLSCSFWIMESYPAFVVLLTITGHHRRSLSSTNRAFIAMN